METISNNNNAEDSKAFLVTSMDDYMKTDPVATEILSPPSQEIVENITKLQPIHSCSLKTFISILSDNKVLSRSKLPNPKYGKPE